MINPHNLCTFEGRIIKDPEFSQVNGANGPIDKVKFTMAIDKQLSKDQRQKVQNGDTSIATADFINCSMIGGGVQTFMQYCPKGKAITIVATYNSWKNTNAQTGQTEYFHNFNVEQFSFAVRDAKNITENAAGDFQQQQQGFQQPNPGFQQQAAPQPQVQPNAGFNMFDNSSNNGTNAPF